MLPSAVTAELHEQIVHARLVHEEDLMCGWGEVWLPDAISRKIPSAARDGRWQWVFPGRAAGGTATAKRAAIICTRRSSNVRSPMRRGGLRSTNA